MPTFALRTPTGLEHHGLTEETLRIGFQQGLFPGESLVCAEDGQDLWRPLGEMLGMEQPVVKALASRSLPSTGIALDLEAVAQTAPKGKGPVQTAPAPLALPAGPPRPMHLVSEALQGEGLVRYRLPIAGSFFLLTSLLGMVRYAMGNHGIPAILEMLLNLGFGVALVLNRDEVRPWALGWVVVGWILGALPLLVLGGCFGPVFALLMGVYYGGPACLLAGEECPTGRFHLGLVLMGIMALLMAIALVVLAMVGSGLVTRPH